jgi:hypothetical protein
MLLDHGDWIRIFIAVAFGAVSAGVAVFLLVRKMRKDSRRRQLGNGVPEPNYCRLCAEQIQKFETRLD